MSYLDALTRASDRARSIARARERDTKKALFEIDPDLDALADFDESEILELRERNACPSRERDLYNDERGESIFGMSARFMPPDQMF
jgi:hypothetical protein